MASAHVSRLCYSHVTGFTTAAPGAGATWKQLLTDGEPSKTKAQNSDGAQESNFYGSASRDWPTTKKSALGFKTRVFNGTLAIDGTGNPTLAYADKPLADYHGAAATLTPSTTVGVASGPGKTTDLVVVSSAGMAVGQGIFVGPSASSAGEFAIICSIPNGTSVGLDHDLAAANYASGAVVYGCFNFFPTLGAHADFLYLNHESDGHVDLLGPGGMFGLKVTGLAAGDGARYEWEFEGDTWDDAGPTPSAVTDGFQNNSIIVGKGCPVYLDNTETLVADVTFNPGLKRVWLPATSGTNGRAGTEIVARDNPTVELTEYYAAGRWTAYKNRDPFPFRAMFFGGSASTNAQKALAGVGLFMPACTVVDISEVSLDGVRAQKVTLKGIDPAFCAAAYEFSSLTRPYSWHVAGGN